MVRDSFSTAIRQTMRGKQGEGKLMPSLYSSADVWVRPAIYSCQELRPMIQMGTVYMQANVGEVSTASVACGVLGVGGNKGGVAVSFTLYRRRLCCVCSHFAAHQVNLLLLIMLILIMLILIMLILIMLILVMLILILLILIISG